MEHKDIAEEIDDFWLELKSSDIRGYSIMSSSYGQGENVNELGIVSGHAYSLISTHEVRVGNKNWRLCKLRNPWGRGEWTGDWSDGSKLWTPKLRKDLECIEGDDGIFFMCVEDYVSNYESTSFCVPLDPKLLVHS